MGPSPTPWDGREGGAALWAGDNDGLWAGGELSEPGETPSWLSGAVMAIISLSPFPSSVSVVILTSRINRLRP